MATLNRRNQIFVFGSNLSGRHGKGAARRAFQMYGAEYGVAIGHINQCYAIPTKDTELKPLELFQIDEFVKQFLAYSTSHPELEFYITRIGTGLAGHKDSDIAPLFNIPESARTNLWFDKLWGEYLQPGACNFFEGEL